MLLSGFLYPFSTLPFWAQQLGEVSPLTHFVRAARNATLRGQDGWAILSQGAPIGIYLLTVLCVSLLQHETRLD